MLYRLFGKGGEQSIQKTDRGKKKPRKINCRQYLIETASGAGTHANNVQRREGSPGAQSNPLFSLVLTMLPHLQVSPDVVGAASEGPPGRFCSCCFVHTPYSEIALPAPHQCYLLGWLLREAWDHVGSTSLCPEPIQGTEPAATTAQTRPGPCTQLTPASAESHHWLLLSGCFS